MGPEDGRTTGRPRTDPRSSSTGPDLEGVGPVAPVTEQRTVVLDLEAAAAHVAGAALRPGPVGPVGLELEAHLVDLDTPASRVPWQRIRDLVDALPALPGGSRVTLEPGGQVELSGPPYPDVAAAVAALRADRDVLAGALAAERLAAAPVGADPLRPPARVCPAPRYAAMEEHFAAVGCAEAGTAMMTGTAALQVNLDAGPCAGWSERVSLAHQLGPTLVAVAACSPLADGRGAAPVRERVSFAAWVAGEVRLGGRAPSAGDLDYPLTTLFPPVRPRGYLEIRYLDAAPEPWWPALAAVTTVLLDDPVAAGHAAAATLPVAAAWDRAARVGLADPALHAAARACLAGACAAVPAALRPEVEALADLVDRGRCPGDALLDTAGTGGPTAVLLSATGAPQ